MTVGTDDEPTAVKDAAKLRAALAKGDPVVELWDDILLDGAPAVATHDAVIEGNNYMIYQTTGARHFVSNGTRLELKNLQLKTGGHPSPAPTCAPTVRTTQRVYGGAHPMTRHMQNDLANARMRMKARAVA